MNQGQPAIYIRARTMDGVEIKNAVAAITEISDSYPNDDGRNPSSFIMSNAVYLKPSPDNELLKVNPEPGEYVRIFELAFGKAPDEISNRQRNAKKTLNSRRPTSEEEFLRSMERNSETGRAGEDWALAWERARLANLNPPCPDPERYVTHIALSDVGAGYDIVSAWPPTEKRYIEVKTTRGNASEFFMTENECRTLAELGTLAWIYRVELDAVSTTIRTFQDPMTEFRERMTPTAWRVKLH